ncbi:hypothetical protein FSP39_019599 [Pinctada imbricata]|uniref:Alkaline phosphatase n=1 Tax=Pinctada imbricata TaxID=66713 RepID=A0AA88YQ04_PINIB|nr:hypothetical protein FSP39_019599 [Pinctada imbricata]
MGLSTVTASRILKGQLNGKPGEEGLLEFEKFPNIGLVKVYSNDQQVPDSAATATAMMCGVKTNSMTLGVDDTVKFRNCSSQQGKELDCMPNWAQNEGKSIGVVTTARITHATPAAAYAKSASREWEGDSLMRGVAGGCKDIAHQLVFNNSNIQVLFGGGREFFYPESLVDPVYGTSYKSLQRKDGLNLVNVWGHDKVRRGYKARYAWNSRQFHSINPRTTHFALGLFHPSHMSYELDRKKGPGGEPSLSEMTSKAIKILQRNPRGFFLLVESGRIDHAHHNNTAKRALYETLMFEEAIKAAMTLTNESDTLMVVTADHSHVFNIAGYPKRGSSILGVINPENPDELPPDKKPWTTLVYGNGPGYDWGFRINPLFIDTTNKNYRQVSAVPLSSETHSGEDVIVYARGPMSHLFHGVHEQHYIAHVMAYASCVGRYKDKCQR